MIADQCAANDTDGRLRHVTTANTARDLDRIREALGERKASFYGASYGSALGASYASMFPESSDRIVLDSNIGDTHLDHDGMRRYGLGVEETFPDFAQWVAERNNEYGLGDLSEEVRRTYFELAERLDEKFGQRSRLVSVDGSGHGVYVNGDNVCAHDMTTGFLVEGDLPPQDTLCPA